MKKILPLIPFLFVGMMSYVKAQSQSDIIEEALSSVVTVVVYKTEAVNVLLGMRGGDAESVKAAYERALDLSGASGSGSGFVVSSGNKKYVITNAHVVENVDQERGSLFVYSITQEKYEVRLVGGDTFYDFAVLEFIDSPGTEITTTRFAASNPRIGEQVFAIGNPLGDFPYSVSDGIISARNRARGGLVGKFGFLQTTATLIWGNSGGPLINAKGEVVGINSQIEFTQAPDGTTLWQSQINFALECELARKLFDDVVKNNGRVSRSYFGIEVSEDYEYDSYQGLSDRPVNKPTLKGVIPNSQAYTVLRPHIGKTITSINSQNIRNINELLGFLEETGPGVKTTFVFGDGSQVELEGDELDSESLEDIAVYVVESDKTLDLDENAAGVYLYYSKEQAYFGGFQKYEQSINKADGYQVLAAGIADESGQVMYRVEDLKDLGAAIRLTSLIGVLDFYGYSAAYDEPKLIRHWISDSENVISKTLYY